MKGPFPAQLALTQRHRPSGGTIGRTKLVVSIAWRPLRTNRRMNSTFTDGKMSDSFCNPLEDRLRLPDVARFGSCIPPQPFPIESIPAHHRRDPRQTPEHS